MSIIIQKKDRIYVWNQNEPHQDEIREFLGFSALCREPGNSIVAFSGEDEDQISGSEAVLLLEEYPEFFTEYICFLD